MESFSESLTLPRPVYGGEVGGGFYLRNNGDLSLTRVRF